MRREEFERVLELEKEEKKVKVKPMEEKEKEKTTIKNKKKSKGMTGNNSTPSKLNPWEETRRKLDEGELFGDQTTSHLQFKQRELIYKMKLECLPILLLNPPFYLSINQCDFEAGNDPWSVEHAPVNFIVSW